LRSAIGLVALGIVGAVGPVGFSVMPFFTPLLVGTMAAFLILLTLGLVVAALRHAPRFAPRSIRSPRRRPVAAVRSTRQHSAT
jgi:nitrate/nitrite transporter NarK